ncbi:MAG TPA: M90 family metallopeptidase [Chitinophagaceae bacterium]|nr:M90 family metallopeptidase [Chitinophagaceae bacterium]
MDGILLTILIIAIFGLILSLFFRRKKKHMVIGPMPGNYRRLLKELVPFYENLDDDRKQEFEKRIQHFLTRTKITGVKTTVEDIDRVLIASSAVIPIFNFTGWEYVNLHEVLLYPDSFDHDFQQEGASRSIIGMVGSGALNHVMILSQHELRQAFTNKTGKTNTAIHEFIHLVDKTDGAIDGVPEFILEKKYILPWLQLMRKEIELIVKDRSDINTYGATNEAEFFAVVSEYFFERPKLLKEKHPELYALLSEIFNSPENK